MENCIFVIIQENVFTWRSGMMALNSACGSESDNRFEDCPIRVFVTAPEMTGYDPFPIAVIIHRIRTSTPGSEIVEN
jgi:hypothetical protein